MSDITYLGSYLVQRTSYTAQLVARPDLGLDWYYMVVVSVDREGNEIEVGLRGRFDRFERAALWAITHLMRYLFELGSCIETIEPGSERSRAVVREHLDAVGE